MTLWIAQACLLLAAAVLVWRSLRSGGIATTLDGDGQRDEALLALRAEQLDALTSEMDDPVEAAAFRSEIEATLATELAQTGPGRQTLASAPVAVERRLGLATLVLLPALALLLYFQLGAGPELALLDGVDALRRAERGEPHDPAALSRLVIGLQSRHDTAAATPDERFLLARAHLVRRDFATAAALFRALHRDLPGEPNLLGAWLQADFMASGNQLTDETRAVAMALAPDHPAYVTARELAAMDAVAREDYPSAGRLLTELLPRVRGTQREQAIRMGLMQVVQALGGMDAIRAHAGFAPDGGAGASPPLASGATVPSPEGEPAATLSVAVDVDLSLAAGLTPPPGSVVFLFARAEGGGPPLAARRLSPGELPARIRLTDADAMIPGRGIGSVEAFTVVARLSSNGAPQGAAGDPEAASPLLTPGRQLDGSVDSTPGAVPLPDEPPFVDILSVRLVLDRT